MKGRLLPIRVRVRSEREPMSIEVRAAMMAEAATIQAIGRGSGVMRS